MPWAAHAWAPEGSRHKKSLVVSPCFCFIAVASPFMHLSKIRLLTHRSLHGTQHGMPILQRALPMSQQSHFQAPISKISHPDPQPLLSKTMACKTSPLLCCLHTSNHHCMAHHTHHEPAGCQYGDGAWDAPADLQRPCTHWHVRQAPPANSSSARSNTQMAGERRGSLVRISLPERRT
jgi:hypothetical protein